MDFFTLMHEDKLKLERYSLRIRRLIQSSINFHALIAPCRTLHYKFYMGEKWQYPRLTDETTFNGVLTKDCGLQPFFECDATSTADMQSDYATPYFTFEGYQLPDNGIRYILLTPDDATDADVQGHNQFIGRKERIYHYLERNNPILFDNVREIERRVREAKNAKAVTPYKPGLVDGVKTVSGMHHPWVEIVPGHAGADKPRAVLIGMHWLQAGGAEKWGLETIRIAKRAGLLPIVITDRDSHQPWIDQDVFDDTLILTTTAPIPYRYGDYPLLRALFEQFRIEGVWIHHCQWIYDATPWIKKYFPHTQIVDSLHITEYRYLGGYPHEALTHNQWIDIHHVISDQLVHWLVDVHGIDRSKVLLAPLTGLTATQEIDDHTWKVRQSDKPLTVAFVGRIARQKRPEAFILVAKALKDDLHYRFIMHGSGEMDPFVDTLIARYHLEDRIERRGMEVPVSKTYAEADVLLISSINEGITLTTIEALTNGIPVLSADIGSQSTLIPTRGLLRRRTGEFVKDAMRGLRHIEQSESDRKKLWESECEKYIRFSQLESASSRFATLARNLMQDK